jgi:hypothetical protein
MKAAIVSPFKLLNLDFSQDAKINVEYLLRGINNGISQAQAFYRRYGVTTIGYPYSIKYMNEDSSAVIPSPGKATGLPLFFLSRCIWWRRLLRRRF